MHRVIFICSGNLCRSPMAAALFVRAATEQGLPQLTLSMGTLNIQGRAVPSEIGTVMAEIGMDVSGHRSQGVQRTLLGRADVICAMDSGHVEWLRRFAPETADRVELLGLRDPLGPREIADPMGREIEEFRHCRDRIVRATSELVSQLRQTRAL